MRNLTMLTLMSTFGVLLMVSCKKDYTAQEAMLTEEEAKKKFLTETNFKPISEEETKKIQGKKIMHFDSYRDAVKYFKSRVPSKNASPVQKSSVKSSLTTKIINSELSRISGYGLESINLYGHVSIDASVSGAIFPITITTIYDHNTNGAVGYLEDPNTGERTYTSYHLDGSTVGSVSYHADGITGTLSDIQSLHVESKTNGSTIQYYIDEVVIILGLPYRDVIECNFDNSVSVNGIPGTSFYGILTTTCNCHYK